jgi:hypothetical protein
MDRKKIIGRLKFTHDNYIRGLVTDQSDTLSYSLKGLKKHLNDLLRKSPASENSVKQLIKLTKEINEVYEFIKQNKITPYDFTIEREQINWYATEYLKQKINSKYDGKCQWHGETLLNLYLELIIKFTIAKTDNETNIRPDYLKNPITGQNLELDIFYTDFKLAFEFQGDFHYTNNYQKTKDEIKLKQSKEKGIIVIPVNACQLKSETIFDLTLNNIKDFYNLHNALLNKDNNIIAQQQRKNITAFKKLSQRMHLSKFVFNQTYSWLDEESRKYNLALIMKYPDTYTAIHPAPSLLMTDILDIDTIHSGLKYLK